jgi:4-hydroxybenzoate polyprenyltransferase
MGLPALRIVHPFPTLMNVAATGLLAWLASPQFETFTVLRLMSTMLFIQCCIGIVNDLADLELDRIDRPDKPLVAGSIKPVAARTAALVCAAIGALISATLGLAAFILAMAGLGCGLVYDLRLKRTPLSAIPYIVALPLLPLWVWVALGRFRPALLEIVPLGMLLGLALHLANALPDYENDEREGVKALAQRLGKSRSIALCWSAYALTILLALGSGLLEIRSPVPLLTGCGVAAIALVTAAAGFIWRPSTAALRLGWAALVFGAVALAAGWLGLFSAFLT